MKDFLMSALGVVGGIVFLVLSFALQAFMFILSLWVGFIILRWLF